MDSNRSFVQPEQKKAIIQFMADHPELHSGKFSSSFTYKTAQKLWEDLSTILNSIPGAKKDWQKWRKTWQDMKSLTKAKKAKINQERNKTGGGPPPDDLTPEESKILEIVGTVPVEGHPGVYESCTSFEFISQGKNAEEEHNYSASFEISNIEQENLPSCSQDSKPSTENTLKRPYEKTPKNSNKMGSVRFRGLQNTVLATERLANQTSKKIELKKNYYDSKIQIMKEDIEVKKRIATSLEDIVKILK